MTTHIDASGQPHMVDVSDKPVSERMAVAHGQIAYPSDAWSAVRSKGSTKGNIETVARIAGIMAAKRTPETIPLCHVVPLSAVRVEVNANDSTNAFEITATARTTDKTGVEMEALAAVSAACLTIYDMTKAVSHDMIIGNIVLERKSGGRSGDYRRSRKTPG